MTSWGCQKMGHLLRPKSLTELQEQDKLRNQIWHHQEKSNLLAGQLPITFTLTSAATCAATGTCETPKPLSPTTGFCPHVRLRQCRAIICSQCTHEQCGNGRSVRKNGATKRSCFRCRFSYQFKEKRSLWGLIQQTGRLQESHHTGGVKRAAAAVARCQNQFEKNWHV